MFKLRIPAILAAALIALACTGAKAAEIDYLFGENLPTNLASDCNGGSGPGYACNNGLSFSGPGTTTFTANGYSNGSGFSTAAAVTWKPDNTSLAGVSIKNSVDESGIGEDSTGMLASSCSDTDCEATVGTSVLITSNNLALVDVIVGSVQPASGTDEMFDIYVGGMTGGLTKFNSTEYSMADCTIYTGDSCIIQLTGGPYYRVGLVDGTGDTLITAVSYNAVPAPTIGQGLPVVLGVGGLLFGIWAWDRSKKRRLPDAAIAQAVG